MPGGVWPLAPLRKRTAFTRAFNFWATPGAKPDANPGALSPLLKKRVLPPFFVSGNRVRWVCMSLVVAGSCLLVAADAAAALQHSPPTSSTPLLPARACRCCRHNASASVWHGCHRTPDTPSPTHLARPARSPLTMRVPRRRRTQLALTSAHSPPPRSLDGETHARRAPARGRRTRPATPPRRVCARYQRAQQPHRRQAPVLSVLV